MGYFFSLLLTPIFFLVFGFFLGVFHPLQWICYRIIKGNSHKKLVDALNFCLKSSYLVLGTRIKFIYNPKVNSDQRPIIFAANHQSMFEIPVLIWYLQDYYIKFIAKKELQGIPSIGFWLKYGGAANIDRNNREQSIREIQELGKRMSLHRWSALIFPEGTRSRSNTIKPFKVAGIASLLKTCPDAIIVPVAVQNSWKMVRYGKFPMGLGGRIYCKVLDPIVPQGRELEEVVKEIELQISQAISNVD